VNNLEPTFTFCRRPLREYIHRKHGKPPFKTKARGKPLSTLRLRQAFPKTRVHFTPSAFPRTLSPQQDPLAREGSFSTLRICWFGLDAAAAHLLCPLGPEHYLATVVGLLVVRICLLFVRPKFKPKFKPNAPAVVARNLPVVGNAIPHPLRTGPRCLTYTGWRPQLLERTLRLLDEKYP
jgi:hypothetical protein